MTERNRAKTEALRATDKHGAPIYVWLEKRPDGAIEINSDREAHSNAPWHNGVIFPKGEIWITPTRSFSIH